MIPSGNLKRCDLLELPYLQYKKYLAISEQPREWLQEQHLFWDTAFQCHKAQEAIQIGHFYSRPSFQSNLSVTAPQ